MKQLTQTLIKKVFGYLKESNISTSTLKVALAVSGGSDSMALALLMAKYGQAVVKPENMVIVHINHGWRGQESDDDEAFVKAFAQSYNIEFKSFKCPLINPDISAEREARDQRKAVFKEFVDQGYTIFTAHNADDLMETMIWRLCEGKLETHDKGILVHTEDNQFRPFLTTTKETLQKFLNDEKQSWNEDRTNHDGKLMRSKLRLNVIPELLKIYPNALEKISIEAIKRQKEAKKS